MLTADGLRRRYSSGRSVIGMQEGIALCRTQDQSGRQSRVIGRIPGPRKIGMVSPELRTSKDRYGVPGTPCPRNSSTTLSARSGLEQTLDLRVEIHGDRECWLASVGSE
jgi:hypothetical protein